MLCGGSIWADDLTGRTPEVTLDFTSNNWGLPEGSSNKQTTSTEYTNSSTNVKVTFAAADGYYYHTSGYVIFGKTNSTITLPAFDFDVDYISVEGRSGASGQVKQNIYVGDEAVSTETTGATGTNVYAIASDYQTAGKVYVLKVTSNANAQVTKINIYKKSGTQDNRAATTISFADGYATSGEPETSIALPTATVKTSDGATTISDAVITWESSDPTVADIDGNNLSLLKYGKATITATYAGDETAYKGCTASYDVTVCGATQDGIFDFSLYNDYGSGYEYGSVTEQTGTWTSGNVTLATAGRNCWYSDGTLRIYKPSSNASNNGKMTFSVPSDKAIKGIVINGSKIQHLTADVGAYSASSDNKTGTWTGNSNTVVLTLTGTDNAVISTITVSYGNPNIDIAAPTFDPAGGTYYGAQNVTLSTTTDGATIKYSTDGETYSDYTGAFEVSATTTIQAYAEIDGEKSATVSTTYTIRPNYTTIAQLHEDVTGDNTPIGFTPESATVVYVNGKNGYLVDNEGNGVLVYNNGGLKVNGETALAAGQVLTGGRIMGSLVSYQGSTEISGFTTTGTTITTADVTPVEKTLPLTSANQSTLVTIKGVTYNSTDKVFSDGTNTIAYYDKFSASPTLEDGKTYDVTAIAVKYDNYIQLCPRTASDIVEATSETTGFRDIKIDLTQHTELLTESNVYITVAEDGTIGTTDDPTKAAATIKGKVHSSYGSSNFTASVPVEGCVKITYATHDYGNDIIVTNSDNVQVAKFNTNGAKWMDDHNNVIVAYYRTNSPTTLTFSNANFNPYFAVEAIDEADLPAEVTNYTVTYAAGEGTGVAPAAVELEAGSKTTAPKNYSLYKEGYTLTGWSDGTTTYAPSDEITPEGDITLTAVYTQNEVSLADREDAVTITYALDGYNDNPKHNFQSGAGIIVTQATVNGKTIDVAVNTNGKFAHNGSGWHQVNANTTVTVPSCKGATFSVKTYNDANALTFGETAATAGATATYTATTDDATLVITQTANGYWNNLTITLPKVEQGGGETTVTGTIFSANVIATEAQNFNTGTTEITSEQATIEGGKMYAISAQTDAKALINAQGSTYYFSMTNNNTYFKVELDNALAVGDVITADGLGGVKSEAEKGLWITTSDGRPSSAPACSGTSATEGIVENILNYTVTEGDGYVGATELYIYRAVGATEYFGNFKITRPENDPNAVATPVITPATGTYTTAQEVSITCDTEGATIYYTTDGNDPTAESTQYTAAFTVSETTTVKAIAINGEYSSDIAESVITITDIQPGQSNLEWSYDAENPIPATSPDNGLYFSGYVNDPAGTKNGMHGVKLNGSGYAFFAKNPVEGKLTLTFGPRSGSSAYAVDVYACTIDGTTATKGDKIGSISLTEAPGTGSLDIPANVTGIYIVRQTSSEGVLSKIVFKEKIVRTFTDFEITNDEMKGTTYDGSTLPTGVTFSGTARGDSHGYGNVTLVVPTDGGAVKFTIGGCQYANPATFTVKNSDGETLATLDQKTPGCYHNGGTVTYFYNGDATTLTFGPMAYLPYFKAEAVDVEEVTVTFKDQNGTVLGTKKVFEGETLGEIPFTEADLTIADGYKFRGWVYTNGVKAKATDIVDGSKSVLASVTEIEAEPTAGTIQNYDLTSNIFYPEDHENFDVADAAYYNNHGWNFAAGGSFSVKVADKAQIVLKLCEYGNGTTITVTDAAGNTVATDVPAKAESGKDGATTTVNYDGGATTLTFTFAAQSYLHKVSVFNVNDFIEKDATSGYYIVPSGDAAGLVLAINAASSEADSKVFLPNGTYDLGTTALTTISGTNVSIIGESMEGVIIKNRPEIEGIGITATLLNTSTGLYMQDLTLDCEAPWGSNGANAERGVTLQDKGTQTICKNVYLKGRQDTYYCNNNNGQYYFEDGKIEGTVDYICGNGDAYFQNVTLFCAEHHNTTATSVTGDCVTAPNTKKEYGYIFNECTIDGVASQAGKYSLGRPWAVGTQVIYLHTKMNILPIEAGWTDWSPANAVQQFAEFHSYDPNNNDADVDLTKRKTDFNGVANSPVLTETQASAFKLSNVFGDWAPNQYTAQVQVEASTVKQLGNTLSWSAADGATMYAIVKNGSIIDLTDQTSYTIGDSQSGAKGLGTATDGDTATGDIYAVRAANARGGFGEAVKATVVDGIETIDADATINGTISEVYSTNGARLSAPQKGINIVKVRTANGTMKTIKVIVK